MTDHDDGGVARALEMRRWRDQMLALALSLSFAGGMLAGVLVAAFGVPGPFVAPLVLAATWAFWLSLLLRRRRSPGWGPADD